MKRICSLCLAAVLLLSALCACTPSALEETYFRLWYLSDFTEDPLGKTEIPDWGTETYAGRMEIPDVMNALLAGPGESGGLTSPIPEGTQLLGWSLEGSIAQVDLSGEYGRLSGVDLTLADYCITLTLTQLEGVDSVRITVEGAEVPGRAQRVLRESDVLFSGAEEEPVELTAALCFRRIGGNELGEELRIFRLTESQSATLAVLQALLAGPQEAGLVAILPPELAVYSARVEAGVCYADFSSLLLEKIPDSAEEQQLVIRSIVESLCSLGHVQAVQILVEGEPLPWYGQVDVSNPLN